MLIDEKTKIPLFVALGSLPVFVIAILWIGSLNARVGSEEQRADRIVDKIHTMEQKDDRVLDGIIDIRERLARIEERLKNQ